MNAITIHSKKDFRIGYEYLSLLERSLVKTDHIRGLIVELKRELRKWSRRDADRGAIGGHMVDRRIIKDDGIDGFIELVSIPEVYGTEPEADEFFKENIFLVCRPSAYDCTGQIFTSWYKLFKRRGQYWAYHSVCFDV